MKNLTATLKNLTVTIPETSCHWWVGKTYRNGYGCITRNGRSQVAHRVAYQLENGEIPHGMVIRHTCDNRLCVNPEHLLLGTQADNLRDMVERGRQSKGEHRPAAKLTADDAAAIRQDNRLHRAIAADYGISRGLVSKIKAGRAWREDTQVSCPPR